MDEQKRLFLAVVLSVVVLFGYQFFFAPAPQPDNQNQDAPSQTMDSSESDSAKVSDFTPKTVPATTPAAQTDLRDFRTITLSTPYYDIAVSEHKAAVTSLTLKDYRETNDEGSSAKQLVAKELADLMFGWYVESGITSNSVIYVKDEVTVGIGTGEQDRVGVAEIARDKAYRKLADRYCFETLGIPYNDLKDADQKEDIDRRVVAEKGGLIGAAMVSDAFFPFRDGVDVGIREGITAVVQPGGSGNDYQSIEACNEADVTMVYTGQRSFKH